MQHRIRLFAPFVPKETASEVEDVLRSGQLAQGPKVAEFEDAIRWMFGLARTPVALNSGTSALETAYELVDINPGDEVITTPLTCTATNVPLLHRKAKIVWADICAQSLCIDPDDVYEKITYKTKAVVQVHLGGVRSEISELHIPIISDAAQAFGIFKGDYTCCSFQAIKHITTGDGGLIYCPGEENARRARLLRWFGIDRDRNIENTWEAYRTRMMCFDLEFPGYKRHMNDIAAAMGLAGLRYYHTVIAHRKLLFETYKRRFSGLDGITLIDGLENTYWLATVLVERRDDFAKMLFTHDIDCNVVQVRNDTYKIFGGKRADLPVLNSIEDKYVSIPIGMHVSEDDVNYICDVIEKGW